MCQFSSSDISTQNRPLYVEESQRVVIADTVPHDSINISSNQDFSLQGWPGNGTVNDPFRIENLNIDTEMSCINVSNTNVFFEVTGCSLSVYAADREIYCLYFNNVTNGAVINCMIDARWYGTGILFENAKHCFIEQCEINSSYYCVLFEYCTSCFVRSSTMNSDFEAVMVNNSSDVEITFNDVYSSYYSWGGIIIGRSTDFRILNNSVQSSSGWSLEVLHSSSGIIGNNTITGGYDGLELNNVTDCSILTNDVSENTIGISLSSSSDCIIESNLVHDNWFGIIDWGANNTYSKNTFNANREMNAEDNGQGNVWLQNWWDDYLGYGSYPIPGDAGSFDTDPEPKNTALLVGTVASIIIIFLSSLFLIIVIIRRVRRSPLIDTSSTDWDIKMRLTIPLVVAMLLPSGVFLYFPADNPARWLVLGATLFGVITWTAYPIVGHRALEFIFPLTDEYLIVFYCISFSLLWFLLSAVLVRRFWLLAGSELQRKTVRRSVYAVLLVMILFSFATFSIPLPIAPLVILLQMSRIKNSEGT